MTVCRCSRSSQLSEGGSAVRFCSKKSSVVAGGKAINVDTGAVIFKREPSFCTPGGPLVLNSSVSVAAVDGALSSPLLLAVVVAVLVVIPVALEGKTIDSPELDTDRVRLRVEAPELECRYLVIVGVALRRESIVIDIAEPGRGLGLGLGGMAPSESVVSLDEYPSSPAGA